MMCDNNNNEKNKLIKLEKSQQDLKFENDDDFPMCSCDNNRCGKNWRSTWWLLELKAL